MTVIAIYILELSGNDYVELTRYLISQITISYAILSIDQAHTLDARTQDR